MKILETNYHLLFWMVTLTAVISFQLFVYILMDIFYIFIEHWNLNHCWKIYLVNSWQSFEFEM